jgi:UDP:flavonoid glycosyltransferase YjiC (YdhE family)
MFLPINGAGLGHLTRCLAIARQLRLLQPDAQVIFVTTSIAVPLVQQFGFICHHVTPFSLSGLNTRAWNSLLGRTVDQLVRLYRPAVFVFDGSAPYAGLRPVLRRHRGMRQVWIRRGGYKAQVDQASLIRDQRLFDQVLLPAEAFAEPGASSSPGVTEIAPVLLLDPNERLTPLDAARALGAEAAFAAGKRFVYVQLGAGNINDTRGSLQAIVAHLEQQGFAVVVGDSPIRLGGQPPADSSRTHAIHVCGYPNSRYFALFEFAVLAGGYNSVCEAVGMGLPAIFLPNLHTVADDQLGRVQRVTATGIYEVLANPDDSFAQALARLLARLHQQQAPLPMAFDGARQAAALLLALAGAQA